MSYNTIIDLFYFAIPDRYTGVTQGNINDAFAEMNMSHVFVWVIFLKGMNVKCTIEIYPLLTKLTEILES